MEDLPELIIQPMIFNRNKTAVEINATYEPYEELMERYRRLHSLDYEEVVQFEEDFIKYAKYFRQHGYKGYLPNGIWPEDFHRIAKRKQQLVIKKDPKAKFFYDHQLIIDEEKINGYKIWDIVDNIMDFEEFKELCVLWDEPDITEEEFDNWLSENLCSDWAKKDRHGECYGGFYQYPKDSYEYENAYILSQEDNIKGLHELPYPKSIIIKTIESGCANRMESVRYSNFICEWIKRKKDVVFKNEIPSLQSLARNIAKKEKDLPLHLLE